MVEFDEPLFEDALFRQKGKRGAFKIVPSFRPALEAPIADTHAHLDMLPNVPLSLARCAANRVEFICSVTDPTEDANKTYEMLDSWCDAANEVLQEVIANTCDEAHGALSVPACPQIPHIRISIGCHPHNAKDFTPEVEQAMLERLKDPRTCAVGEVGLDFHYDFSPRETQRHVFRRQIQIAHETGLPLILHVREAHIDALKIMNEEGFPAAGVLLHCFNLDYATLEPWLAKGCYVAFGGPVTFKKSDDTRAAAVRTPRNRILTETDAPFMAPEPMRGMTCGPEHVIFTAAKLAEACKVYPGEERKSFLEDMYHNARGLLDRDPSDWQRASVHEGEE